MQKARPILKERSSAGVTKSAAADPLYCWKEMTSDFCTLPYRNQEWESKGHLGPFLQFISIQATATAATETATATPSIPATSPSIPASRASIPVPGRGTAAAGTGFAPDSVPTAPASCAASVQSTTRNAVQVGKFPLSWLFWGFFSLLISFFLLVKGLQEPENLLSLVLL